MDMVMGIVIGVWVFMGLVAVIWFWKTKNQWGDY